MIFDNILDDIFQTLLERKNSGNSSGSSGKVTIKSIMEKTIEGDITAVDLKGVTKIGPSVFSNCVNITSVVIPEGVTAIEHHAFSGCKLKSVTIPASVKEITGESAFDIRSLQNAYYNGDLASWCNINFTSTYYSNPAGSANKFYYKNANGEYELLEGELVIPDTVTEIKFGIFCKCDMTRVVIPEGVTSIGNLAFNNCSKLTSISIPNSVTSIGEKSISHCDNLVSVVIPNSVTSIGDCAFYDCDNLTSVRIGSGITSIPSRVFASSSITDIYIDKPEGSVSGAPWSATNATIHWNTPLPSEEV